MLRLIGVLLVGYVTYRIGREFIESIPDDFEPVPEPSRGRKSANGSLRARRPSTRPSPAARKGAAGTT